MNKEKSLNVGKQMFLITLKKEIVGRELSPPPAMDPNANRRASFKMLNQDIQIESAKELQDLSANKYKRCFS
jgi:hypothetical protein